MCVGKTSGWKYHLSSESFGTLSQRRAKTATGHDSEIKGSLSQGMSTLCPVPLHHSIHDEIVKKCDACEIKLLPFK